MLWFLCVCSLSIFNYFSPFFNRVVNSLYAYFVNSARASCNVQFHAHRLSTVVIYKQHTCHKLQNIQLLTLIKFCLPYSFVSSRCSTLEKSCYIKRNKAFWGVRRTSAACNRRNRPCITVTCKLIHSNIYITSERN